MSSKNLKYNVHRILNEDGAFSKFIYTLIVLNIFSLILESYEDLRINYHSLFFFIEIFSIVIFSIEYILRLWVSDINIGKEHSSSSLKSRILFIFSPLGLIDLLAILPFYLPLIFPFDLRILRILRLMRLLRIFKLGRLSKSLKTIGQVLNETKSELTLTIFVAFILMVLSSTLMYYIEHDAQPDKFASIGHSLWWAIATLTTVGYGDIYPITALGRFLSAIIALIGIGFIALPTGIISSAFIQKIQNDNSSKECTCPNCGTKFKK